ncbi:hypothetical protein [Pedobacter psychroterrae]|uniref:Immunity protein 50 of polymorphic toxin system n=1 Tax=Pedobacter psychroterrae TaxID=2530453 RepID=A0A4R0N8A9_9SPHI|nr:hypothetical protein [Pedobacter psychroterrae]TCC96388.1 hypothetical protein EZ437_21415 [Pedobacter psychroterrae]
MKFEEYYWHGSEIRNIEIDRRQPGENDTISFEIDWSDSGEGKLIFEDVYWTKLNLNFGIVAPECIDLAFVSTDDDSDLIAFYKLWGNRINDIKLTCYVIKTLSTGSEIKIIAKGFKTTKS